MPYIKYDGSTLECFSVSPRTKGNVWPVPSTAAEIWTVPGTDGLGVGLGSMTDPECEVECVAFGTSAEVTNWISQFNNILGATCEVLTTMNELRHYVVLLEITESRVDAAVVPGENVFYRGLVTFRSVVKYKYTRRPGKLSTFVGEHAVHPRISRRQFSPVCSSPVPVHKRKMER